MLSLKEKTTVPMENKRQHPDFWVLMLIVTVVLEGIGILYLTDVNSDRRSQNTELYMKLVENKRKTDSILAIKDLQIDSLKTQRKSLGVKKEKVQVKLDSTVNRIRGYTEISPTKQDEKDALLWIEQYNSKP